MNLSLRLLTPVRKLIEPPKKILSWMDVKPGMNVADIGCGPGYLTIPLAEMVGPQGKVYAIEIDEAASRYLREKAERLGLSNVEVRVLDASFMEDVPNNSVDLAVMLHSLHHFNNMTDALKEAYRIIKPGGKLAIIDPIRERMMGHGTSVREVSETLSRIGFDVGIVEKGFLTFRLMAWKR